MAVVSSTYVSPTSSSFRAIRRLSSQDAIDAYLSDLEAANRAAPAVDVSDSD